MAKRPRRAPPTWRPGNPGFSAPQRTKPRAGKTLLKTSQNFPPRFPLIFPSPAPKVLHKNPVTEKRAKKENAAWAAGEGAGCPAACGDPESPLANFGSVGGAAGCGVSRKATGAGKPDRPIKRKINVSGAAGCGVSRGVGGAGRPASRFWQREQRGRGAGLPAKRAARGGRGGRPPPAKSPYFPVYFHKIQTKCVKLVIFHKKNCENSVKKASAFYLHFRRPERILKLTSRDPIGKKKGGSCDES